MNIKQLKVEIEKLIGCNIYPTNTFSGGQLIEIVGKAREQAFKDVEKIIGRKEKELKQIDEEIPDKFKILMDNKTNQHMRLKASIATLEELKKELEKVK